MKISAVILTKNEEKNIERCLKSLNFCDEVIIVDDFSTDKTLDKIQNLKSQISNKYNIQIFKRELNGDFAEQRNFAMTKAKNDWVLFLDADEEITPDLKKEIKTLDLRLRGNDGVFYIKRRDFFWGKDLKYGEVRKIRQLGLIRLVKKGSGYWQRSVHEEFKINNLKSKIGKLRHYINHYPHQTLKEFIQNINFYSNLRAKELYNLGKKTNIFEIIFWPIGKFIYNYIFNFGFLDGTPGFAYAFMMSFHSFLVRAKLWQHYFI